MKFDTLMSNLSKFQFETTIGPEDGERLYNFILQQHPQQCLELGFAHGTSSCYIAAALDELRQGHLTSVDLERAREWQTPSIEELLAATGLGPYVTVRRESTSYTWFLKKQIEENTAAYRCDPLYDFCFIDGAKHWTIDGFAFFLVDKLLKEGGWLLFDDLAWTRADLPYDSLDYISFQNMGKDELHAAHIDLVFRLLIMQHPSYAEFRIENNWWAWAHKVKADRKHVVFHETRTLNARFGGLVRRLKRLVN